MKNFWEPFEAGFEPLEKDLEHHLKVLNLSNQVALHGATISGFQNLNIKLDQMSEFLHIVSCFRYLA